MRPRSRRPLFSERRTSLLGLVGLVALSALTPGCAEEFDTTRVVPKRGSVGTEMYGVICDRVGAQALREDLTGGSFRAVCHANAAGIFGDRVDVSALPPLDPEAVNERGEAVSMEAQTRHREAAVARIEALGRRRADLIRALDATFPAETRVGIKDLDAADETKSCQAPAASGEGLLTDQIADMLGRMSDLYADGTLEDSTRSLAHLVEAFKKDDDAQAAWSRLSARQGYRPIATALGVARPVLAYPKLRDFANASLRLLSADSQPYQIDPARDEDGRRRPVPGPGNGALVKLIEAGREELLAAKAEPRLGALTARVDSAGRGVLSRPRDNLELLQELLYTADPAFASGPSHFIVRRDARGYAAITGGAVPTPFVDRDDDGMPDVDTLGRFVTLDGSLAPSPFPFPGAPEVLRDDEGRVLAGSRLLYDYIDTSNTFAARLLADLKPLANPDPEADHETLMETLGGLQIALGERAPATKTYERGAAVSYSAVPVGSPILDLIHALGAVLGDKSADATLSLARELFATEPAKTARVTGALLDAFDVAQRHPEAKIPATATFWDEAFDVFGEIAREPGLLEDILHGFAAPQTAKMGTVLGRYAAYRDEISYDRKDINGPAWNLTTNSKSEMRTPVDRDRPETGDNRSALHRFLALINDTTDVTACNKPGAVVHAKAFGVSVTMPLVGTYEECEVFKIDNLAAFYLDAIAEAYQYDPPSKPNKRGTFYLRNDLLRTGIAGIGAASAGMMEDSSGLTGFWTPSGSQTLAPKPAWLNRLVFFDVAGDRDNPKTSTFIRDLQGTYMGSRVCAERVIDDPLPGAPDAAVDRKIRGLRSCNDGQWLQQRGKNTIFTWENFDFYETIKPVLGAFVKHGREDLFLRLSNAAFKHWPGAEASDDECKTEHGKACPRAGMNSYEPLLAEALAADVVPALSELAKMLETLPVKRCETTDARTGACTRTVNATGIEVAAAATRAMVDPVYAKENGLTDRRGIASTVRNDGTKLSQVTPIYLLTNALGAIDDAFGAYQAAHPGEVDRQAKWRRARSQLVDQFLRTEGEGSRASFVNPTVPKITPVVIDLLRSQLLARCPRSFSPPYERCDWARDELTAKAEETLRGPLVSAGMDVLEAVRADPEGRRQVGALVQYMVDSASKHDALASALASVSDLVQLLQDDENLIPLFRVMAAALDAGEEGAPSLVDAQMALLARVSGKYFDADGKQICKREIDPNQVLTVALGNLVTPMESGELVGQTPLEVIMDVIADVNRVDPSEPYDGTLPRSDYASVAEHVVSFLTDRERGLEQFYAVIKNGIR